MSVCSEAGGASAYELINTVSAPPILDRMASINQSKFSYVDESIVRANIFAEKLESFINKLKRKTQQNALLSIFSEAVVPHKQPELFNLFDDKKANNKEFLFSDAILNLASFKP